MPSPRHRTTLGLGTIADRPSTVVSLVRQDHRRALRQAATGIRSLCHWIDSTKTRTTRAPSSRNLNSTNLPTTFVSAAFCNRSSCILRMRQGATASTVPVPVVEVVPKSSHATSALAQANAICARLELALDRLTKTDGGVPDADIADLLRRLAGLASRLGLGVGPSDPSAADRRHRRGES